MTADALGKWIMGIVATILVLALGSYIATTNRQLDSIENRLDALVERQGEVREQLRHRDVEIAELTRRGAELRQEARVMQAHVVTLETQSGVLHERLRVLDLRQEGRRPREEGP